MRGGTVHNILAELAGKSTGISKERWQHACSHINSTEEMGLLERKFQWVQVSLSRKSTSELIIVRLLYGDGASIKAKSLEVYNIPH